ncbi:hypothetical protein [Sphingobacterium suaedae]|uniref:Lasso RiPP family leader peptide-containing protein n=1 Tax=Sphingobacterium suaedae TaxID=1686402 RepID=A0ABW5KME7_9SPHI
MKKHEKKVYVVPTMEVLVVELEQGIAAGSGTGSPSASPSVDDWGSGGGDTQNGDF